jgi:hypothetical protein
MQIRHLLALVSLFVWGVLCAASCVQNPTATSETDDTSAITSAEDGAVGEAQEDLKLVTCPENDPVECMIRCGIAGIPCRPRIAHPFHPDRGDGNLVRCAEVAKKFCTYRFDDGEECAVFSGLYALCIPARL